MKKQRIQECILLTDQILTHHYRGNHEELIQYLHVDSLWIGSTDTEYYRSKQTIIDALERQKKDLPLVNLSLKNFYCISHDRNGCTVVGRYLGTTDEESQEVYCDTQRVTFVWKEKKNQLMLMHTHISNPLSNLKDAEIFPHSIGSYTRNYLNALIQKEVMKKGILKVKDFTNVIYMVPIGNIVFLEAFNTNTIIHTDRGDIMTRMLLSHAEAKIKEVNEENIIRVHKSYAINRIYVTSIQRYKLCMEGNYQIPISKNRYLEVKEELYKVG